MPPLHWFIAPASADIYWRRGRAGDGPARSKGRAGPAMGFLTARGVDAAGCVQRISKADTTVVYSKDRDAGQTELYRYTIQTDLMLTNSRMPYSESSRP